MKTRYQNIKQWLKIYTRYPLASKITNCFLLSILCMISCKKYVDIPPPKTSLVTASVFSDGSAATSAQITIYTQMWANAESPAMAESMGIYADELQSFSQSTLQIEMYTNSLIPLNTTWSNDYKYIYEANAVINGLQTNSGVSPAVKQQLTGEAYFIRAFWHFYLTNIYGDVPLVLTPDYTINGSISRTSRIQILQQVIADLKTAQNLLNSNYVDASDTITTTERVRPNKATATALLARAYLYLGDYSKDGSQYVNAETQATTVISNSTYSLSTLNGVFLKNSSEAIWQLQTPSPETFDTEDGYHFVLLGAPLNGSRNYTTISAQLLNTFESGDQRRTKWLGTYTTATAPTVSYNYAAKYKNTTLLNQEYTMVLRLGEQYLIRAEARAQQGNLIGATTDLNVIRTRAGLGPSTATTQVALLTAILHERQVELFAEWGHRWFDLVRTGNANAVMGSPGNVCQIKGGIWSGDGHQLIFPIPQADRNSDPNLTQNPGY